MRHRARIMFAAGCVGLLAASAPALSLPAPQRAPSAERIAAAEKPAAGWPALVVEARKYMGTNPTDRKRLWCATFMNFVLARVGYDGTHSDAAKSFAYYGRRIAKPRIGAIAVLRRGRRGGHVGVVTGVDSQGNPIIISGNHNDRVGEGIYPRARVIAYVMPTERHPVTTQLAARSASVPPPDKGLDSPITELIAAIEAEHARTQRAAAAVRQRVLQRRQLPERQRVVQQMPQQQQQQQAAPSHSEFSLDPLLTKLFGPDDRGAPRRVPPAHQQRAKNGPPRRLAVR
jgi:uncharacterized protein (TIGR02594 family)